MKINGFEDYEVLEDGTVVGSRGKALKPDLNSVGYERVILSVGGKMHRRFVHKLVAGHFCEKKSEEHKHVNHIDGNRTNNHASNLEWVTPSYNVKDGFNRGRKVPWQIEEDKSNQILAMRLMSGSTKQTCEEFGIERTTVQRIVRKWRERATTIETTT